MWRSHSGVFFFFFNDTATTEIYTLSLHDALPIWLAEPLAQHAHLHELGLTQSGVALGEVLHGIVQPLFLILGLGVGDAAAHDVTEQLIARLLGQRWSRSAIRLLPVAHAPS